MRDGGKGDTQRPLGVPIEQFDNAWDRIFGTKQPKVEEPKNLEPIPFAGMVDTDEV